MWLRILQSTSILLARAAAGVADLVGPVMIGWLKLSLGETKDRSDGGSDAEDVAVTEPGSPLTVAFSSSSSSDLSEISGLAIPLRILAFPESGEALTVLDDVSGYTEVVELKTRDGSDSRERDILAPCPLMEEVLGGSMTPVLASALSSFLRA